ncbi:hypothetical protein LF817_05895 [Halobacillus sp. A1]|uniref:hypothetical protein n=1 Tax=Halobacillus sp. A1 TaxID=2880262 RepID=UPI0020A62B89|nr:hypothetical protein [Halobacillus sp. A1]MCP3030871.1 hypothetical protein [Halobacillus sp. A1]
MKKPIIARFLTIEKLSFKEEAVSLANDTIYDLADAVWPTDIQKYEFAVFKLRLSYRADQRFPPTLY